MIDLEFVQQLIRTLDESSLDHVEIERGGTRIRVSKTPTTQPAPNPPLPVAAPVTPDPGRAEGNPVSPAPAAPAEEESEPAPAADDGWIDITSPMVGTFYRAPSPGADVFTDVGSRVEPGDTLCIIEAMKLMNELEAEVEGVVREIHVEDGEPVEYGQVLFRVEPA